MRISNNFNVQRDQMPDSPSWMDRLLSPLNQTLQQVILALQTNITIGDNVVGKFYSIPPFTTGSTYSSINSFTELIVPWEFQQKKIPQVVLIGNVVQPSNQPALVKPITIPTWTYDGSSVIRIPFITGLADSSQYSISLIIL